jgi:hypothetical protein
VIPAYGICITWDHVEILTIGISIPRRIGCAQPMRSRDKLRNANLRIAQIAPRGLSTVPPRLARACMLTLLLPEAGTVDSTTGIAAILSGLLHSIHAKLQSFTLLEYGESHRASPGAI